MFFSPACLGVVQLTGLVKVALRYFFDWAMSFFQVQSQTAFLCMENAQLEVVGRKN